MRVEAIVAESLACQRGGQRAVSGLSFEVRAGSVLVLRGPNGSGKTTLLRTIAGFLPAASGRVRVIDNASSRGLRPPHPNPLPKGRGSNKIPSPGGEGGVSVSPLEERVAPSSPSPLGERVASSSPSPLGVRGDSPAELGDDGYFHYIGHANGIKPRLSVIENASFWGRYYGGGARIDAIEAALDAFGLLHLADYKAAHLSQGQARRLGLARLLAAPRPIWLLDEPSVSLDAASTALLENAIAHHRASGGISIVSTHMDLLLPEATILDLGQVHMPQ